MPIKKLLELLNRIEGDMPSPTTSEARDDLTPFRDRIDAIDLAVLTLLNERSRCANAIGRIKKRLGVAVYVPSREEEVMRNIVKGNTGPLPDEAAKRLFERIIDETRSLERHLYEQGEKEEDD